MKSFTILYAAITVLCACSSNAGALEIKTGTKLCLLQGSPAYFFVESKLQKDGTQKVGLYSFRVAGYMRTSELMVKFNRHPEIDGYFEMESISENGHAPSLPGKQTIGVCALQ